MQVKHDDHGILIEEARAAYLADLSLLDNSQTIYRIDGQGHRYYYTLNEDGRPSFYVSVTSLIKATMPTSPALIQWIKRHGDNADDVRDERAAYGTFLHIQIAEFLENGVYDLDAIRERAIAAQIDAGLVPAMNDWHTDAAKDMLAFAQFVAEKNVRPLAIEIPLVGSEGYSGTVDLVCDLDFNRKRVTAIVDFKSGRKGFWTEHEIQLEAYRRLWQENCPDVPIDMLFNWSPKDWRTGPSYNLKNQTDTDSQRMLPHLVELWRLQGDHRPRDVFRCSGKIAVGADLSANYHITPIEDVIAERS